jgi:hypothetical protein
MSVPEDRCWRWLMKGLMTIELKDQRLAQLNCCWLEH